MRNLILVAFLSVLVVVPCAAQADAWRGLVLDVSTSEDAIRILGPAKKDQPNQRLEVNSRRGAAWLNFTDEDKAFRKIVFSQPEGFAEAKLFFKNEKLVAIELVPKRASEEGWLDPDDLASMFSVEFKPHNAVLGGKPIGTPEQFASEGDPATKDKLHPYYEMIAVGDKSFIFASVNNTEPVNARLFGGSSGRAAANAKSSRDRNGEFPGHVTSVQIFSRTLSK